MSIDRVLRHSRDCPGSTVLPGCLDRGVYEYQPGSKTFPGLPTVPGTPGMLGQGSIDRVLRHSRDCPQSSVLPGCLDENRGCMSVDRV